MVCISIVSEQNHFRTIKYDFSETRCDKTASIQQTSPLSAETMYFHLESGKNQDKGNVRTVAFYCISRGSSPWLRKLWILYFGPRHDKCIGFSVSLPVQAAHVVFRSFVPGTNPLWLPVADTHTQTHTFTSWKSRKFPEIRGGWFLQVCFWNCAQQCRAASTYYTYVLRCFIFT